ncbi:MAG: tubulin-like doman-containing protein, partial [Chloroflexales bacterium]
MPEVANPSVIIGLGGTGKWVLTYLKKSLLDTYGGEIPPTVRLLSFDTTSEKASRNGEQLEEDVRVGEIQLSNGSEFIYLGGNIEQICRDIRDKGAYPHIASWLQAKFYLQATDARAFDISGGAGQKRPFGRMAVFYDLQQALRAQITNKISTAITDVKSANKKAAPVEIYIIASLAGGTGAGMFIDVAHLARWFAARSLGKSHAIRSFLVLHNTFNTVIGTNQMVQPNAFAAMRELDRFMLVFDQQYPIVYNPSNPDLNTIYGGTYGKLFDNCYLLDATRERMPLDGVQPKYGVYPSIADAITMLLDGSTGETYTTHYVNVNNRIAAVQSRLKVPIYSSLGTFSLILPVEDIITSLANRFASDLLATHLLNLEERTNDAGQKQMVLVYEGDAKKEAAAFLQRPKSDKGLASTSFIQRVPNIVNERSLLDDAAIADVANMAASELLAWIIPPESDPTVEELANKVREDLEIRLATRVPPSNVEGDDPVEGCGRILRGVTDFKRDFIGREEGGRKVGGVYQKALERCRDIHRERYRKLLQEYLLNLLNGPSPTNRDYQAEKRGRLGQTQALLSHLSISYFNELSAFIDRIKARRAKDGDLQRAQEHASLLRSEMEMARSKSSFLSKFFRDLHPAVKAQQEYLA